MEGEMGQLHSMAASVRGSDWQTTILAVFHKIDPLPSSEHFGVSL
jgi:hypothetical protein